MLSRKQRVEYLLATLVSFCSGALLYCGLVYFFNQFAYQFAYELQLYLEIPDPQTIPEFYMTSSDLLHAALGGGFVFSAAVSGIIISVRFFSRRGLAFKLIATFFAPLTALILELICFAIYLPYQIYNLIQIIRLSLSKRGGDAPHWKPHRFRASPVHRTIWMTWMIWTNNGKPPLISQL